MKSLVIIPAYNEAPVIGTVIRDLKKTMPQCSLVVIDDGSTDETGPIALQLGVPVIRHPINRGLGGAIGTGLEYAKQGEYDVAVTFDADGQHDPKDIGPIIEPIKHRQVDIVIGTRMKKNLDSIPVDRQLIIKLSNIITFMLFGFRTSDSLSGFRAFSKKAMQKIRIKTQEMEVSNEIFSQIKRHGLLYAEVPISIRYTAYSRSKGQPNSNALNVGYKLLLRLAR